MSRKPLLCLLAILFCAAPILAHALPVIELKAGFHRIEAEVAATGEHRQHGLMHRRFMASHHGMLFVYEQSARHCMWMKNTLLPLSVAFLDSGGRIINVEEMQPRTERIHCAARPARFALEMNAGWFSTRGLGPGAVISGTGQAPMPR